MKGTIVLLGLRMACVVDRVEDTWAVIEWASTGELTDVPVALLPPDTHEGDRLVLRLRRHRDGKGHAVGQITNQALITDVGRLELPNATPVCAGCSYQIQFQLRPLQTWTGTINRGVDHDDQPQPSPSEAPRP